MAKKGRPPKPSSKQQAMLSNPEQPKRKRGRPRKSESIQVKREEAAAEAFLAGRGKHADDEDDFDRIESSLPERVKREDTDLFRGRFSPYLNISSSDIERADLKASAARRVPAYEVAEESCDDDESDELDELQTDIEDGQVITPRPGQQDRTRSVAPRRRAERLSVEVVIEQPRIDLQGWGRSAAMPTQHGQPITPASRALKRKRPSASPPKLRRYRTTSGLEELDAITTPPPPSLPQPPAPQPQERSPDDAARFAAPQKHVGLIEAESETPQAAAEPVPKVHDQLQLVPKRASSPSNEAEDGVAAAPSPPRSPSVEEINENEKKEAPVETTLFEEEEDDTPDGIAAAPSPPRSPSVEEINENEKEAAPVETTIFEEEEDDAEDLAIMEELRLLLDNDAADSDSGDENETYEQKRQRKLRQNEALLAQLGLGGLGGTLEPQKERSESVMLADEHATLQTTEASFGGGHAVSGPDGQVAATKRRKKHERKVRWAEDGTTKDDPPSGFKFALAYIEIPQMRERARNEYCFIDDVPEPIYEEPWSESEEEEVDEEDNEVATGGAAAEPKKPKGKRGRPRKSAAELPDGEPKPKKKKVIDWNAPGTTCHQCRRKTLDDKMRCSYTKGDFACPLQFCQRCIEIRYGLDFDAGITDFKCPRCMGYCNCSICLRKTGHGRQLVELAPNSKRMNSLSNLIRSANGDKRFGSVREYIEALMAERNRTKETKTENRAKKTDDQSEVSRSRSSHETVSTEDVPEDAQVQTAPRYAVKRIDDGSGHPSLKFRFVLQRQKALSIAELTDNPLDGAGTSTSHQGRGALSSANGGGKSRPQRRAAASPTRDQTLSDRESNIWVRAAADVSSAESSDSMTDREIDELDESEQPSEAGSDVAEKLPRGVSRLSSGGSSVLTELSDDEDQHDINQRASSQRIEQHARPKPFDLGSPLSSAMPQRFVAFREALDGASGDSLPVPLLAAFDRVPPAAGAGNSTSAGRPEQPALCLDPTLVAPSELISSPNEAFHSPIAAFTASSPRAGANFDAGPEDSRWGRDALFAPVENLPPASAADAIHRPQTYL